MDQKSLYERYNTDDILMRSVIAGLLNLLNNKINYSQTWEDNIIEEVTVPWWYSFGTSSERFMQDNYTSFGKECTNQKYINGNFPPKPVGWLTYTGSNIDAGSITNRFVQVDYMRLVGSQLIPFHAYCYSIPLTVNFDCKIECDNVITSLKIEEALRSTFYKNKTYYVEYKGMQIGCCVGFPESINGEKTQEYSFDNAAKTPILTFSLVVETYQPVFDKTTEMERGKVIKEFATDIHIPYNGAGGEKMKEITLKNIDTSIAYPSGTSLLLEWDWNSKDSDFLPVTISYIDSACDCEEKIIAECTDNHMFYIWNIPDDFTGFTQPEIMYPKDADIIHKPIIKISPDKDGRIMDTSFTVVDRGYIAYKGNELPITLEYEDNDGNPVIVQGYRLRLDNGRIIQKDPIVVEAENIHTYKGEIKSRKISIKVAYSHDLSINSKIDNLLII